MKKVLACLILAGAAAIATATAPADCPADQTRACITFFDGLAGNADTIAADGVGAIDVSGYYKVSVHIISAAGSQATINCYRRNSSNDAWINVLTITDPSATELGYDFPPVGQLRFELAWTSGTITGTIVRAK